MAKTNRPVVISLGGSIIVPNGGVDTEFLKKFKAVILKNVRQGHRFVIICGGGSTSRHYQKAARSVSRLLPVDIDWLGIHATRLNAYLMKIIFREQAHKEIFINPNKRINWHRPIIIGAGWKPGWSTDYVAALAARKFKARMVVNLSNIDYVYTRDPRKFRDAKKIKTISWPDFKKLIGGKWVPGAHLPFDPVASKLAEKSRLKVVVMNGRRMGEFERLLLNKDFKGTIIG